ncbi:uncharacterized protein C8Q71DRAFT_768497 [Rhodofomes roseus]|uniref:TFIIE beta domain-containing protein n=1 Tax=Rhodofomes roseus TaxID=34475 RepID=A0ABQ8KA82_9APHY|nr:uncharacterized protein C8Q71DRAFT_768497 [Rhodofomes roseus]KAH9834390.1 hypothetical protein C8Q71DRAFT_768497 [Rhodofomes roseus]
MAALARDAAAFKSALHRQDYSSWHAQPEPAPPAPAAPPPVESSEPPHKKKKRPKSNVVYSQPADTGTGTNVNTQLVYLVNHLKSNGNPMRLQDLAIITNIPVDTHPALLEKFRAHDRVVHDPRTDLYSYRVRMLGFLALTDPYPEPPA